MYMTNTNDAKQNRTTSIINLCTEAVYMDDVQSVHSRYHKKLIP